MLKISWDLVLKYPELIELINSTNSMDKEEKQYWIDILPTMTDEQVNRLFDILETERKKLEELDLKYEKDMIDLEKYRQSQQKYSPTLLSEF